MNFSVSPDTTKVVTFFCQSFSKRIELSKLIEKMMFFLFAAPVLSELDKTFYEPYGWTDTKIPREYGGTFLV